MNEEVDINAVSGIVVAVAGLAAETFDNLEDGKISKFELMGYMDNLVPTINALLQSKEALGEIKEGLNEEERAKLVADFKNEFDISDDDLEGIIEDIIDAVLGMIESGFAVASAIKSIRNRKKD